MEAAVTDKKEPTLTFNLLEKQGVDKEALRRNGMRLDIPGSGPAKPQKRQETRDKNIGRKVVQLPSRESTQEVHVHMTQSTSHEQFEKNNAPIPGEVDPVAVGNALQSDMHHAVRELHELRRSFDRQTSLKAEGIRLGAYALATTAAVVGGTLIAATIMKRGNPELPSGAAKK